MNSVHETAVEKSARRIYLLDRSLSLFLYLLLCLCLSLSSLRLFLSNTRVRVTYADSCLIKGERDRARAYSRLLRLAVCRISARCASRRSVGATFDINETPVSATINGWLVSAR